MEWRIFFPVSKAVHEGKDTPLDLYKEVIGSSSKKVPEKRYDLYILFGNPAFGLKIRNCKESSPSLELKVRTSRSESGVEQWEKVLVETFKEEKKPLEVPLIPYFEHLSLKLFKFAPSELISRVIKHLNTHSSEKVRKCASLLQQQQDISNVKLCLTQKSRHCKSKDGFVFEQTDIEVTFVNENKEEPQTFRSVCLESHSSLENAVSKYSHTFQKLISENCNEEMNPAGYPEFLMTLAKQAKAE